MRIKKKVKSESEEATGERERERGGEVGKMLVASFEGPGEFFSETKASLSS